MASTTARVPFLRRFYLYNLCFPQSTDRIRAVENAPCFTGWKDAVAHLQTNAALLARFPREEPVFLKQSTAQVLEQFGSWNAPVPRTKWVHWPIWMAPQPILLSIAMWIIGEDVFSPRSHPYYLWLLLTVLSCVLSRYVTPGVFRRLHRDSWATLPVQMFLSGLAAFPRFRFLYSAWWNIALNIILTCILVHFIQYLAFFADRRRDRAMRRQPGPGIGADAEIGAILDVIEPAFRSYKTDFSGYYCDYVHNTQDVLIREGNHKIIKILRNGLSPQARNGRPAQETHVASRSARQTKLRFEIAYDVIAIFNIITLVFKWGSFAQGFTALYAVGLMLRIMTADDSYTLDPFLDFYTPKVAFMFWSLFHVNIPLLGYFAAFFRRPAVRSNLFSDYPVLFWVTYAAMMIENLFLTDLLVYSAKRYLKMKFGGNAAR